MIVLDTHIWIWLASDPDKLSSSSLKAIKSSRKRGVSVISCWEFATLIERGRISVDRGPLEWIEQTIEELQIELIPLTPAIAVRSTQLARTFRGDPADCIIVATAIIQSAVLVTKDKNIRDCGMIKTIW